MPFLYYLSVPYVFNHLSYDPRFVIKLNECYRCHPDILRIPNELFYNGDLLPSAELMLTTSLLGWKDLPNPNVPLLFHGIQGEHMREGNSPSWFNPHEVSQVVEYCHSLVGFRGLSPEQIGIIAPYRKQCEKVRLALKSKGPLFEKITVGSCEQFQGTSLHMLFELDKYP
jgi:putative helicase MOV10L1